MVMIGYDVTLWFLIWWISGLLDKNSLTWYSFFNPILDGVWCRCHTLQLLKPYYSKMIHPTHTIIPYIWSHEYPLRLEPNFFSSKFQLYLSYITCDEVNENSPSKIGLNNLKKLSLTKTLCGMVMSSLLIIFPRNKQTWFYPDKRVSETYFVQEMLFMA